MNIPLRDTTMEVVMPSKYTIPRVCQQCGTAYLARRDQGTYCSRSCSQQSVKDTAVARIACPCAVCGKVRMVTPSRVANGRGVHCSRACRAIGISTHGETRSGSTTSPEYMAWASMKTRCLNPAAPNYPAYGGRGITICDRWRDSFEAFLVDMGRRPSALHSIDRIDVDGQYEPSNCRWATTMEQAHNRRTNRLLTWNGTTQCVSEWARMIGVGDTVLLGRLAAGWSVERTLTEPLRQVTRNRPRAPS
jgi:hypothetical protein